MSALSSGEPAGGVPGGGRAPADAAVVAGDRDRGAADRGRVERRVGDRLDPREELADGRFLALPSPWVKVGGEAGGVDPGRVGEVEARGMWKSWVTTTASWTSKIPRARTIVAQVSKPAWSSKITRGGTPSATRALRIVSGSS